MTNRLFEFTLKVRREPGCDLPVEMAGAYVPAYAAAPDVESAVTAAVAKLRAQHFSLEDVEGKIREIPVSSWTEYVAAVWPDCSSRFPAQTDLPGVLDRGGSFFGPFAGYDAAGKCGDPRLDC